MKSMKRAIILIIVLNVLAMLGGAAWLLGSGRVNKDRVLALTELFDEPVQIEQARLEAEQKSIEAELAAQEKPLPEMALNSEERNRVRVERTQIDRQRLDRMKREVADLQAMLRKERRILDEERAQLQQDIEDFDEMRRRLGALEGDAQFRKSLDTLAAMGSEDAKAVLNTMIETGSPDEYEKVVAYLSAMAGRARVKIITEFVEAGQEELAANLLDSVRLYGLETATADGNKP